MTNRERIIGQLVEGGVVAVVRLDSADGLARLTDVLQASGIIAIEFTMTTPGALKTLAALAPRYDDVLFGAGTVIDAVTAQRAVEAGVRFLVSPILKKGLVEIGHQHDLPVALGTLTPTEMQQAYEWGADFIKVFPASSVGPGYVKAVRGPLPHLRLMPTGGVGVENAADYIKAGAACLGVGGKLVDKKAVAEGRMGAIAGYAAQLVQVIEEARLNCSPEGLAALKTPIESNSGEKE